MTDKTAREAMREMGQQADPIREALRRMIAEFGDQHYHTCPADNDSGPCECFAGFLVQDALHAIRFYAHPETLRILAQEQIRFSGTRTGIWRRAQAAWLVFTGRADALSWEAWPLHAHQQEPK